MIVLSNRRGVKWLEISHSPEVRISKKNQNIMSAYPNPSCSECEEAIHVYCKKNNDEKFKLLEQAHCAKCWRPLYYNTNWPGKYSYQVKGNIKKAIKYLCWFSIVWADRAFLVLLKFSPILLKYLTFEGVFSCFHAQKKTKPKKLINLN